MRSDKFVVPWRKWAPQLPTEPKDVALDTRELDTAHCVQAKTQSGRTQSGARKKRKKKGRRGPVSLAFSPGQPMRPMIARPTVLQEGSGSARSDKHYSTKPATLAQFAALFANTHAELSNRTTSGLVTSAVPGKWRCTYCTHVIANKDPECDVCQNPRGGGAGGGAACGGGVDALKEVVDLSGDGDGADSGGADRGGSDPGGGDSGGPDSGGADPGGADSGGADRGGADSGGADRGGGDSGGGGGGSGGGVAGGAGSDQWTCGLCTALNTGPKYECATCGRDGDPGGRDSGGRDPGGPDSGAQGWACKRCTTINTGTKRGGGWRDHCAMCGEKNRPRDGKRNEVQQNLTQMWKDSSSSSESESDYCELAEMQCHVDRWIKYEEVLYEQVAMFEQTHNVLFAVATYKELAKNSDGRSRIYEVAKMPGHAMLRGQLDAIDQNSALDGGLYPREVRARRLRTAEIDMIQTWRRVVEAGKDIKAGLHEVMIAMALKHQHQQLSQSLLKHQP